MHALILGGTGIAGRALIEELRTGRPGVDVTAVSRTATVLPGVRGVLTGHYGDLVRSGELKRRLESVDVIVHLADGLSVLQQRRFAADAAEAERLLAASVSLTVAARAAKVRRLVYVSSIKAICDEDDARVLTETDESRATGLYGRSKLRLEQSMTGLLKGSDTRLTIVRNPAMYGAGKGGSVHRLLQLADTPLPLPLADLSNRRSLLAVRNFASALAAIVRADPGVPDGIFHIHDGPPQATTEMIATLRAALGRPSRLYPIGAAAAAVARRAPLIGATARRLYGSLELSDAHFRRSFRWTPAVDTKTALAAIAKAHSAGQTRDAVGTVVPSAR
jgi:nucleoside-diphosphate-sugar epimerase